jgi:hypothetical protein
MLRQDFDLLHLAIKPLVNKTSTIWEFCTVHTRRSAAFLVLLGLQYFKEIFESSICLLDIFTVLYTLGSTHIAMESFSRQY